MKLQVAWIGTRAPRNSLEAEYLRRIQPFVSVEALVFRAEEDFLAKAVSRSTRTTPVLVLLDGRGKQFTSEQFAEWLGRQRDQGRQRIIFAIGPANGWSDDTRQQADMLLSLGSMTLPHELARLVLCEQIYRAFTILSGHPYHTGH
jgi:23S rRNA (pseudouridine1915-N3)-methyltransferase